MGKRPALFLPKLLSDRGDVQRAKGRLSPAPNTPHSSSFVAGKLGGKSRFFWTCLNSLSMIWTRGSRASL